MSAVALIAAIGMAQAAPAPAPSPLFAAFAAACTNIQSFDRIAPAARSAGWRDLRPEQVDERITRITTAARDAVHREAPTAKLSQVLMHQTIDRRSVYLSATQIIFAGSAAGTGVTTGCRVYDLDMPAMPPRTAMDHWVGKAPDSVQADGTAIKRRWSNWTPRTSLEISFVPRNEKRGQLYGIQGLILVSQSNGGF